ncbi:MAG TPA: S8 family peptidase, partial [Isosphaeraceae bacterium]|nr:S8 family peptidase [Isosphaeraceae bacterium]
MARFRHFVIQGTAKADSYVATFGGGGAFKSPPRDEPRVAHGERLATEARQAAEDAKTQLGKPAEGVDFVPIVVRSDPGFKLWLDGLEDRRIGSEVIAFRYESDDTERATVHIPRSQVGKFAKKFEDYAHRDAPISGNPQNQKLAEGITELRLAVLRDGDYWTDSGPRPKANDEFWWEVWLRDEGEVLLSDGRAVSVEDVFREEARSLGIRVSDRQVKFPDLVVVLAYSSLSRWSRFSGLLRYLAEFRRASLVVTRFLELPPAGQAELINDLLERTTFAGENAPAVCVLDRGVNRGHPLLEQALGEEDNLAWEDEWTSADRSGHGTEMAGLALFGENLGELLLSKEHLKLVHRLEAVKVLPDHGENEPPDYGPITLGSVAKVEISSPSRNRVLCMAVTADDKDEWLPTLWSAAIDQMCSGATDDTRRLMVVSAGNFRDELTTVGYPLSNHEASVQDPAQAWNVVTVGAYTQKVMIEDQALDGWSPLAPKGRLCPTSTTSCGWEKENRHWPVKPDIVMEGGNYAYDADGYVSAVDDLSLLTTVLSPDGALLSTMRDTSAATALAARFAAMLQAKYPVLWPESIRGLLVHSAHWTKEMRDEYPDNLRHDRLRCYGYGVPNFARARRCATNRATMIIQDALQPFRWDEEGKEVKTKEMHVHSLPWPVEMLQDLGGLELRMRVTLSYFIEPSPGRRGWNVKHRYQSHGL